MLISRVASLVGAVGMLGVLSVRADLVGSSITDTVVLTSGATSVSLAVESGTIGNGITDFTSSWSGLNIVTVEFNTTANPSTLTITDKASLGVPLLAGSVTLVDSAFQDIGMTLESGATLPGLNLTQNGSTIVITWSGASATLGSSQTLSATYVDPRVDEPSSSAWLGVGLGALALALLSRKQAIHQI